MEDIYVKQELLYVMNALLQSIVYIIQAKLHFSALIELVILSSLSIISYLILAYLFKCEFTQSCKSL